MKVFLTIFAFVFIAQHVCCQYYYNDIIVLKETNRQYQAIKNARITQVTAQSFEADDQPTEGFTLRQTVKGNEITTISSGVSSTESVSVNTYDGSRITKTVDNSTNVISTVNYTYDATGNVQTVSTVINDTFMNSNSEEVHQWYYTNNTPAYMLRIKDKTDTVRVDFVKDEQGNIAEEHWKRRNTATENYFYYYNNAHQLTDVVRFNLRARKMLPDFLFEYNTNGMLAQLTQVPQLTGAYLVWHYEYNANGLKQKETCFDRQKRLVGRIEYQYK